MSADSAKLGGGALTGAARHGLVAPDGWSVDWLEVVNSTNAEALRRAACGAQTPCWIVAGRQTAGRGRGGRAWTSDSGNLFATALIAPGCALADLAQLSFVAALAVADLAGSASPDARRAGRLSLKWPNDVLIDGRKTSGVLIETITGPASGTGDAPIRVAVGIGVNLVSAPPPGVADYPTARLADLGDAPSPATAFNMLARAFADWLERWRREGFAPVREAWLALGPRPGDPIRARTPRAVIEGRFVTLDATGALALDDATGRRHVLSSADILPANLSGAGLTGVRSPGDAPSGEGGES